MRLAHYLGVLAALVVGYFIWGLSVALLEGGGGAPFGKSDTRELLLFYIPIVVFALPLALIALMRGHIVTAVWILAVAPILGFLNFILPVFLPFEEPKEWNIRVSMSALLTLLAIWLVLLGSILAVVRRMGERSHAPRAD